MLWVRLDKALSRRDLNDAEKLRERREKKGRKEQPKEKEII